MSETSGNPFRDRLGTLPLGEMAEVDDELRATVPPGCLLDTLEIRLTHAGPGAARATMPIASKHLNQAGVAQAGAIVSLADAVAGWAAKTALPDDESVFVTLELHANVLRPGPPGSLLEAVASPVHVGRTTMVFDVQVRLLRDDGPAKTVASFGCTQMVITPQKSPKEAPRGK